MEVVDFYLSHKKEINNRDLVDVSADKICGQYLLDFAGKKKAEELENKLREFLKSESLRERRIAMISTFQLIKNNNYKLALEFTTQLLGDNHDLIHKAVGRMLREIWKRNSTIIEQFLQKNYTQLSRTTLRYAIEKFPEEKRKEYLNASFQKKNCNLR
jgi:3-methyladenine DNA glycosylase AlkD